MSAERKCRICGCAETNACAGGCFWVAQNLCSHCAGKQAEVLLAPLINLQVGVQLPGLRAFQLLSVLQLAYRHPELPESSKSFIQGFGAFLEEEISLTPEIATIIEQGWNPVYDVPSESRIIVP